MARIPFSLSQLSNLSRRGFLLGSAAAFTIPKALASVPSCTLTSEKEEGPYYVDDEKLRSDITEGKPGVPVKLRISLMDARRCSPLANTALDIWHCDSLGVYSGFTSSSPDGFGGRPGMPPPPGGFGGPPPGRPGRRQIDATRFLRGAQITNDRGIVEFTTVYPGWYSGRAIHIHLKAHVPGDGGSAHVAHTGQLFFPEDITQRIAKLEPYAKRLNVHRTTQGEDGIFNSQHGGDSMVTLERVRPGSDAEGFTASVVLAVDPEATPAPVGGFGRGRRPGPPPRS